MPRLSPAVLESISPRYFRRDQQLLPTIVLAHPVTQGTTVYTQLSHSWQGQGELGDFFTGAVAGNQYNPLPWVDAGYDNTPTESDLIGKWWLMMSADASPPSIRVYLPKEYYDYTIHVTIALAITSSPPTIDLTSADWGDPFGSLGDDWRFRSCNKITDGTGGNTHYTFTYRGNPGTNTFGEKFISFQANADSSIPINWKIFVDMVAPYHESFNQAPLTPS